MNVDGWGLKVQWERVGGGESRKQWVGGGREACDRAARSDQRPRRTLSGPRILGVATGLAPDSGSPSGLSASPSSFLYLAAFKPNQCDEG